MRHERDGEKVYKKEIERKQNYHNQRRKEFEEETKKETNHEVSIEIE